MPREPTLGSSSYRKQTVPNCSGLSRQGIFNAFIQSAYFVGVESFLVHLKKGPPERVSRDLLNCVADCLGRCGKSHIRYGSHRPRSLPAGEQLGSGAIVEKSHFTLQSACLAARQHIEDLTGRGSPERKREDARTSGLTSSISWWVSNDGALRHQRPLRFAYGGAGGLSQGETGDFLSIMTIYSARPQERPMRTHRFGRKIKLPATIAIKHQIRMRMAQYEVKKAEAEASAEVFRGQTDDNPSMSSSSVTTP